MSLGNPDAVVRVIVVTFSPGVLLDNLLDSLEAAVSVPYEVVLADNGSVDGAPECAAERDRVTLLPMGSNVGYGRAANAGARDAVAPWLLICNPDLRLDHGSIDRLMTAANRWPRGGAFGPAILEPDGATYPSARSLPSFGLGSGHAVLGRLWPTNPWTRRYLRDREDVRERTAGWLSGACLLVRTKAWLSVNGFDPRYFMYFEDVDLGDRLARAGWSNIYVPSARATHVGGSSTKREPKRMLEAHHRSAALYVADRYPFWAAALVSIGLRCRQAVVAWKS